jgi:hypothetical protein
MDLQFYFGLLVIAIGAVWIAKEVAFLRGASVVKGKIAYVDRFETADLGEDGQKVHVAWPVVEFVHGGGEVRRIVDIAYRRRKLGEQVWVAFPPRAPEKSRIYTVVRFWALPALVIAAGLALVLGPRF